MNKYFKDKWFSKAIRTHQQAMYLFALSMLHNEANVDDALQNTILIAYEKLDQLRNKDKFKSWVFSILKNECLRILRVKTLSLDENIEIEDDYVNTTVQDISLWEYIETLDNKYSDVIILFYYQELTINEIAEVLDISTDNVKQRLTRARKLLKEKIRDEFYE